MTAKDGTIHDFENQVMALLGLEQPVCKGLYVMDIHISCGPGYRPPEIAVHFLETQGGGEVTKTFTLAELETN